MANSQIKTDPFAKLALIVGLAVIALTLFILLNSLKNTIEKNTVKGEVDTTALAGDKTTRIKKNLEPIGVVTISDGSGAVPSTTRSGEEVYKAVCAACHDSGAANAPKLDDKAAWEPRIANGFDTLLQTAINGKGAMPARGGQNVPDDELTTAITYMIKKAGFSLDAPAPAATEEKAPAPAAAEEKAPAPAATEEKAPAPAATEEKAPAPKATEEKAATPEAAKVEEKPVDATPAPKAEVAVANSIDGKALYKKVCFVCHDTGAANAPKLTDKAVWAPRIALGKEALYNTAINGKGAMPPKGGNTALSDDEVKATVDYIFSVVQ